MSRKTPLGFVIGIAIEAAAIVFVISLLPQVDLRPSSREHNQEQLLQESVAPSLLQTIKETAGGENRPQIWPAVERRPASYGNALTSVTAPPRAESSPVSPVTPLANASSGVADVEQRLDRASQQLLNGVGSYVSQAAGQWSAPPAQPVTTLSPVVPPSFATGGVSVAPTQPTIPPRPSASPAQHRPWIRY
jgi:hypothetical protein